VRRWKEARQSRAAERKASDSLEPLRSAKRLSNLRWGWGPPRAVLKDG
jgi:hypothetical protein